MTDQPFTPHADSIQTAWVLMCQQSRVSTQPPVDELEAEFDRFIAQVRAEAWDEGQRAGLGDGITAAELAIGRRLDLLPGPTPNPYRQETQR